MWVRVPPSAPRAKNCSWLAYALVLAILATTASVVALGNAIDRQPRQVGALVRDELAAVERQDLAAALATLEPAQRERWRDFVANQLGNRYTVQAISVRSPSLLDRWLHGQPPQATSATLFLVVNPGTPETWSATTLVRLAWRDGQPFLTDPPLAPSGEWRMVNDEWPLATHHSPFTPPGVRETPA
ncbi:MAG: hypothetical protein HY690_18710 [Chloroflexi bacterium]|nr:hypothetical protein [Chloroflexota bacterium]